MAQAQVEREASARCNRGNGGSGFLPSKLPNTILGACYALNTSNSKRVIVGFEKVADTANDAGSLIKFELVLKFVNAGGPKNVNRELVIKPDTWEGLVDHFDRISTYFDNDYEFYEKYNGQRTLTIQNYEVFFTTSYGAKSFLLEQRPRSFEEVSIYSHETKSQDDKECKKMKLHLPHVVMQRVTFEGLKSVSGCINAQIERLQEHEKNVNTCAGTLKEHIRDILQQRLSSEAERKNIVCNELELLKFVNENSVNEYLYRSVKANMPNDFIERYFDVVFEEMITFHLASIGEKIRKEMFYN